MAAANDSASARVLNALLLRFLEPSGKVAHQDTRHRFPCPYRAVLNFPGTLAFSGVFIYAAKLFVTDVLLQFFLSNFCTIFPQYGLPVSSRNCTI